MNGSLKISSWNVRGFGDLFRGRVARRWINRFHRDLDVIGLQELKARKDSIEFQLQTLFLDSKSIVDYSEEGRVGATIIILSNLQVLDQGLREMVVWLGAWWILLLAPLVLVLYMLLMRGLEEGTCGSGWALICIMVIGFLLVIRT